MYKHLFLGFLIILSVGWAMAGYYLVWFVTLISGSYISSLLDNMGVNEDGY